MRGATWDNWYPQYLAGDPHQGYSWTGPALPPVGMHIPSTYASSIIYPHLMGQTYYLGLDAGGGLAEAGSRPAQGPTVSPAPSGLPAPPLPPPPLPPPPPPPPSQDEPQGGLGMIIAIIVGILLLRD